MSNVDNFGWKFVAFLYVATLLGLTIGADTDFDEACKMATVGVGGFTLLTWLVYKAKNGDEKALAEFFDSPAGITLFVISMPILAVVTLSQSSSHKDDGFRTPKSDWPKNRRYVNDKTKQLGTVINNSPKINLSVLDEKPAVRTAKSLIDPFADPQKNKRIDILAMGLKTRMTPSEVKRVMRGAEPSERRLLNGRRIEKYGNTYIRYYPDLEFGWQIEMIKRP
jgi:hypothetical protein